MLKAGLAGHGCSNYEQEMRGFRVRRFARGQYLRAMSASPIVLAALADAKKTNAIVSAILTFKVTDRLSVKEDVTALIQTTAAAANEAVEEFHIFPHIAAARVKGHPPLIRALLARPEVERANSGLTQAPFAFGSKSIPAD